MVLSAPMLPPVVDPVREEAPKLREVLSRSTRGQMGSLGELAFW
jgi:hypothetical protein